MTDFRIDIKELKASEGSHIPVLVKILSISEGPVLELGTGFNSTAVIHWICNKDKRKIVSYESSEMFYLAARNYQNEFHDIHHVVASEDWDDIDIESQHWGVAFIDHAPGKRRNVEMGKLANNVDYVVVHDTESKSDWHYHFSNHFNKYKYRFDYTEAYPNTSVFSNFKDLSNLSI